MKLKAKILTIVIVPIVLVTAIACIVSYLKVSSSFKSQVADELEAAAGLLEYGMSAATGEGEDLYELDEHGDLWNGIELSSESNMKDLDTVSDRTGLDLTVFYGDTRRLTTVTDASGNRVLGTQAGDAVIEKVLKGGQTYFAERVDVVGMDYYAYYMPLYDSSSSAPVGMIFAGRPQKDVDDALRSILLLIVGISVVVAVICGMIAFAIVNAVVGRIKRGVEVVSAVADGDLTVQVSKEDAKSSDEVGDMLRAIIKLKDQLNDIVSDIITISESLHDSSDHLNEQAEMSASHISQVDTAVNEIAQGATTQAEETQDTTENVIVMGDMIEKNNKEIANLNANAQEMDATGQNAINTLKELEVINEKTKDAIDVIYAQTNTTNESASKIREAINLITDIAEETNLLSLNASIEAARAGEQGRGFAVVAGQIQKLAEQSNDSARKIEEIVASLIEDSDKAVATMNEVRGVMAEQSQKVERTSEMFRQLKTGIDVSVAGVSAIADSTRSIDKTRVNVVDSAQSLTSIAQENAASSQETSAAVSELTELTEGIAKDANGLAGIAKELNERVQFFKVDENAIRAEIDGRD